MSRKDIFPNMSDDRDRSHFRLATSRREELTLQQELDNVGKKSVTEIVVAKEIKKIESSVDPEVGAIRKLAPEFITKKTVDKRKSQPVFHEGLKTTRAKSPVHPTLPAYNPLDKEKSFSAVLTADAGKTKKLPFSKENTVTTTDMKKQRVTSLGVLPNQKGRTLSNLNVLMEGSSVTKHDEDPVLGPVERANTAPKVDSEFIVTEPTLELPFSSGEKKARPAILGSEGTLQSVMLAQRQPPATKPMSRLKMLRTKSAKSTQSDASSFKSMDIHLPGEHDNAETLGQGDSASQTAAERSTSSAMTMKSVKDLVEEAKKIATPEAGSKVALARKRERKEDTRKSGGTLPPRAPAKPGQKVTAVGQNKKAKGRALKEEEPQTTERSVDEIIKSLKEQASSGVVSEADRKIQEILKNVMSRSKDVLGDLAPNILKEDDVQPQEEEALFPKPVEEPQNMEVDVEDSMEKATDAVEEVENVPEDTDSQKEPKAVEDTEAPGGTEEAPEAQEQQPSGRTSLIDEALERLSEVCGSVASEKAEKAQPKPVDDTPDLQHAWDDLLAPSEVAYEDIINVTAKPSKLHGKSPPKDDKASSTETQQQQPASLLTSWVPAQGQGQEETAQPSKEKDGKGPLKSIHHFCTVREDIQLPDHQRGVWRRYHVPSKYDYLYKDSQYPDTAESTIPLAQTPASQTPGSGNQAPGIREPATSPASPQSSASPQMDREDLVRRQSLVAQHILDEAAKVKDAEEQQQRSLEEWQQRAQAVFDQSQLTINGKKMDLKCDESFLYWTPAPPKWDVPSKAVKSVLFPSYHGATLDTDLDAQFLAQGSDDSDAEEEMDEDEEDAEARKARERILSRQHGSARDLTNLDKNKLHKAEELATGLRNITGTIRLPRMTFSDQLEDKESAEYSNQRAEIETMFSHVFSNILGEYFKGIQDMGFSGGSLVVHYAVSVPVGAPPELSETLEEGLMLAIKRGMFGELVVDAASISVADDLTTKADLLVREMSRRSTARRQKLAGRRETSDVTGLVANESVISPEQHLQRRNSAPGLVENDEDDTLLIYQDYNTAMEEVKRQRHQLKENKSIKKKSSAEEDDDSVVSPDFAEHGHKQSQKDESEQGSPTTIGRTDDETRSKFSLALARHNESKMTPAEEALEAGRSYVLLPNKSQKKKQKKIAPADMVRIESIEAFANQKPRLRGRRESFTEKKRAIEWELRVPARVRHRKKSLPRCLDFEDYKRNRNYKPAHQENEREWVRGIWEVWFDQTYPPTPPESDWGDDGDELEELSVIREDKPKRKSSVASTVYSESVVVPPVTDDHEEMESIELLTEEVERLDKEIENSEKPNAFDFCRRGAIQRKLGNIKPAIDDLTNAVVLEPTMLDAYWHRHFVFVLLNKKQGALDDLNMVLKLNKQHSGAYKSRAAIHRDKGDITLAIVNYTQAIKFKQDDDDAYYRRAEMYEERGEVLLAMEDYAQTFKINPRRTEALFRHGMHYYKNGNWQNAIQDFTDLLKHDPNNAEARMLRGRTYSQLKQWNQAVEDLSASIHLDPRNSKAFYYRACLLRKLHPKKAVQDYSVSLMLDDSEDNILSYLHRGILYNEIGRHEDAMPDFEAVLKLDKDMASAHVNLGLICMQKLHNHQRAIKKFSAAIKADPTCLKAYICRAEAYTKVHDIRNALLDITRAIHLKPDMNHLYMYRGQLVLKMGKLDLAAFCVRHAADLGSGLGQSPTQQAIVQTFLKNYDKAIEALEAATRVKPVPPLFMLLGKTRMKAQLWKDAVDAFEKALDLVKPWQSKQKWPPEAAEMYYLIGMCQMEMRDYLNAHDAFNNAIQVDKKLAEAYYWRGMTRMKLKQSKGIQDFNRALALDPELFQAYLSRAAYYGLKGQYTKGILNCNEAIRLQPTSVRGYLYRGALKYHIKAYTLAIKDLTKAIAIDSTCALAYFNRAVCYHDSSNFTKALQDYGVVLLLGEYLSIKVLINRGLLYFEMKDYKNALHDLLMASNVSPRDKRIHHMLGLCYHKLDKLQEAVKSFTRALNLDNFFLDALIGRGNTFMDFGHEIGHTYARHDYERALHLDPCCLPARVNLAYNLQVAGKFQQAWHQFTAAIGINNEYKPALEGRAIINLQMSDTFAAFQDISASVRSGPTAELLTNRGVIHQFMGDRINAMRDYQKAIHLDDKYSLAYFNAANIYFHSRQFKQACDYYDKAIANNNKDESAFLNRAIAKVMLKEASGALQDFDSAIKLSPHSAHMYFNRGNLYASLLVYEKADRDYTKALELRPDDPLVHKRRAEVRGKLRQKDLAISDYRRAIMIRSQHGRR